MNFDALYAMACDNNFKARVKYSLYKKAIEVKKSGTASAAAKGIADKVLADQYDYGRLAFAITTEAAIAAADDAAAVTDALIDAAAASIITALV